MSAPRTYIGPFGRILPVPDGVEPEGDCLPCDETRTNMTTYSLPPPDRLQFGSDASPGFTDPTRYNTISQSSKTSEPNNAIYREISRQANHEHLPSLRHMLTPAPPLTIAQHPPQEGPIHTQQRPSFPSDRQTSIPDTHAQQSRYSPYQSNFPHSQLPASGQTVDDLHLQRDVYQICHPAQQFPSSYDPPPQGPIQLPYPPQPQQPVAPNAFQPQQLIPVDPPPQSQSLSISPAIQYYPEHRSNYDSALISASAPEQGEFSAANHVKPLPRVIGEGDVPGEGPSWFYEDGTTCKKIIDGEPVNAQWGVTKAGKPRKRLAIACTTCREKKIKCDPAEPKCVQCEKFGRECRFTTQFRNQHSTSRSPSYESQARTPSITIKSEPTSRLILPLLSTSSSVASFGRLLPLATATSTPSMQDAKSSYVLKRRESSTGVCDHSNNQSSPADNSLSSVYKSPTLKRQRSNLSSPISPKAETEIQPLKDQISTVPACKSHIRPWEDSSSTKTDNSCHCSNDSYEIKAKARTNYLGMHRNLYSAHLSASMVARNVRAVIDHARRLFHFIYLIYQSSFETSVHDSVKSSQEHSVEFSLETPFLGYAILTAVDVLSAAGSVETYEDTMTVIHQSLAILDKLSKAWVSARGQGKLIRRRLEALVESVDSKESRDKSAWKCKRPLDPSLGLGHDVFYDSVDVKRTKLFEYLGLKVREDEILVVAD